MISSSWESALEKVVLFIRIKEAGNSFQHFSNSHTSVDEHYHRLTSDATIL